MVFEAASVLDEARRAEMRSAVVGLLVKRVQGLTFEPSWSTAGGDLILFGPEGILDSLELVSFAVAVEDLMADEFDINVHLLDESILEEAVSPFQSLDRLISFMSLHGSGPGR